MFNKISKRITYYLGGFAIILAGLLYLIMTDLTFGNTSVWLLSVAVCAFGGGICMLLSANFKEKVVPYYILKSISVVAGALLAVVIFLSRGFEPFTTLSAAVLSKATLTVTLTGILAIVGSVACFADTLLNLFLTSKEEE